MTNDPQQSFVKRHLLKITIITILLLVYFSTAPATGILGCVVYNKYYTHCSTINGGVYAIGLLVNTIIFFVAGFIYGIVIVCFHFYNTALKSSPHSDNDPQV